MDSKLEARLEKIENRLDALWRIKDKKDIHEVSYDKNWTKTNTNDALKINGWRKVNKKHIVFVTEVSRENVYICKGYGFDENGNWNDKMEFLYEFSMMPIPEEEVKEALIKEAMKRGFKKGKNCYWEDNNITHSNLKGDYIYSYINESLSMDCKIIYQEGKWAEILNDEVKKGEIYYHNIYQNLKSVAIENTEKERFESVVISEDKNCGSEAFKIGKITECWLNEWTKVEN